jgi:ketosteroid isomerase-like protein
VFGKLVNRSSRRRLDATSDVGTDADDDVTLDEHVRPEAWTSRPVDHRSATQCEHARQGTAGRHRDAPNRNCLGRETRTTIVRTGSSVMPTPSSLNGRAKLSAKSGNNYCNQHIGIPKVSNGKIVLWREYAKPDPMNLVWTDQVPRVNS